MPTHNQHHILDGEQPLVTNGKLQIRLLLEVETMVHLEVLLADDLVLLGVLAQMEGQEVLADLLAEIEDCLDQVHHSRQDELRRERVVRNQD
jgi:hypothetical protein